jgi:hypothetical protein
MRARLLGGLAAIALISGGALAHPEIARAETQVAAGLVTTDTSLFNTLIETSLAVTNEGLGNFISANGDAYSGANAQVLEAGAPVAAATDLQAITSTGGANVSAAARGNVVQLATAGQIDLAKGEARPDAQFTGPTTLQSSLTIGLSTFDGLIATSTAVGNGIVANSTGAGVGIGNAADGAAGMVAQTNTAFETAHLSLDKISATGAFTGSAQALGNSTAGALTGAATLAPSLNLHQINSADQVATAELSNATLTGAGNSLSAIAFGNSASFGATTTGLVQQSSTGAASATTTIRNATINGDFSAQAVGNVLSFISNSPNNRVSQDATGPQTAAIVGQALVLNGATTFSATALGNQFSGPVAPGVPEGAFWNQHDTGVGPKASVSLDGISGEGSLSVSATAVGNLASLTNPDGFLQQGLAPTEATVSITNNTFNGGMSVSTTTMANMITIH